MSLAHCKKMPGASSPIASAQAQDRWRWHALVRSTERRLDHFLLPEWRDNAELARRARLTALFALLGSIFGTIYAAFYLFIGHYWGAAIIIACSLGFAVMPWVMRYSLALAGNSLAALMTAGFAGLCGVEGGLQGHAVAWLAGVPLCVLLLADSKTARLWVAICFAVCAALVAAEIAHIEIPKKYDPAWEPVVNSAGYLGLIVFMFVLGLAFENGRKRAFTKMQVALDQLAASHAELVVLNREKTEFLGIAAHDLRTPLSTIVGYAQLLQMGNKPADVAIFSQAIHTAGSRMRDLIKNLLDANAVEEGRFTCQAERCEMRQLLADSIRDNQSNADRKEIAIIVEMATELTVLADYGTTVQVLDNLISNAVKYSPFQTTVRVHCSREAGEVLIAITDAGPGISEQDQAKLFGRFARLSAQPTGGESSTGLGLSIAKKLAEAMSGTIVCQSSLGGGSTFSLRLPAAEPGSAA